MEFIERTPTPSPERILILLLPCYVRQGNHIDIHIRHSGLEKASGDERAVNLERLASVGRV
jgi:hypothetical protein